MTAAVQPLTLTWPEAMKEYRRRRGTVQQPLKRAALATELGISPRTIYRFERGTSRPRPRSLLDRTLRETLAAAGIVVEDVRS